ncbi:MAG: sigma-70 family RNA polymerase sigma factor [Deltaproteobacteria bacterium]|nr:sigma-70 family RNA polymerase sigma factor [Deltaproteobacteria bacterium]
MAELHQGQITILLERARGGDRAARDELLPLVYKDLEAIAKAYVNPAASLEPRGLVHELYLKIASAPLDARDRKHFFAIAALAMRQILTDRARKRKAGKRGGDQVQVSLSGMADGESARDVDALAIETALAKLEKLSPRQARIVEMRCLLGLSVPETAEALDLSERTVHAEWRLARAWLSRELT